MHRKWVHDRFMRVCRARAATSKSNPTAAAAAAAAEDSGVVMVDDDEVVALVNNDDAPVKVIRESVRPQVHVCVDNHYFSDTAVKGSTLVQYAQVYKIRSKTFVPAFAKLRETMVLTEDVELATTMNDIRKGVLTAVFGIMGRDNVELPNAATDEKAESYVWPAVREPFQVTASPSQDLCFLEDEVARCVVIPPQEGKGWVGGMPVMAWGVSDDDGKFHVRNITLIWDHLPSLPRPVLTTGPEILFVSGLQYAYDPDQLLPLLAPTRLPVDKLQLIVDYVGCRDVFGDIERLIVNTPSIVQVVVAGNFMAPVPKPEKFTHHAERQWYLKKKEILGKIDVGFSRWAQFVNSLVVVPGWTDSGASIKIPQKEMPDFLFPVSSTFPETFRLATNPTLFSVNDVHVVGTAGQPTRDMMAQSGASLEEALVLALECGHIAPTCPATYPTTPLTTDDPLILPWRPHIYFAGNQTKFYTKFRDQTLIVAIPEFHKTHCVVRCPLDGSRLAQLVPL